MSDTFWLALIAGLPATLTALTGLITSARGRTKVVEKVLENQKQMHQENAAKIQTLHDDIDGRVDQLIEAKVDAAIAKERAAVKLIAEEAAAVVVKEIKKP